MRRRTVGIGAMEPQTVLNSRGQSALCRGSYYTVLMFRNSSILLPLCYEPKSCLVRNAHRWLCNWVQLSHEYLETTDPSTHSRRLEHGCR